MQTLSVLYLQDPMLCWLVLGAGFVAAELATGRVWLIWPALGAGGVALAKLTGWHFEWPVELGLFALLLGLGIGLDSGLNFSASSGSRGRSYRRPRPPEAPALEGPAINFASSQPQAPQPAGAFLSQAEPEPLLAAGRHPLSAIIHEAAIHEGADEAKPLAATELNPAQVEPASVQERPETVPQTIAEAEAAAPVTPNSETVVPVLRPDMGVEAQPGPLKLVRAPAPKTEAITARRPFDNPFRLHPLGPPRPPQRKVTAPIVAKTLDKTAAMAQALKVAPTPAAPMKPAGQNPPTPQARRPAPPERTALAAEPPVFPVNGPNGRLVGRIGRAAGRFVDGAGRIWIDGAEWDAEISPNEPPPSPDAPVRVMGVKGGDRLQVKSLSA